ncbi:DUF2637 domain-containing protein [Streptomyces albus]|uniref:DUF2637 domain-containing protein n=1 Tax=Streptomyces albus TaxID=1888 RepID=UPI0037029E66
MTRFGKALLIVALVAVVGMAFRVSWNALSDVARAVGADATAATLYPFVVDGLMALALVATLTLTERTDKRFALRVLATYTLASLALNYVHGLVPGLHDESVDWGRLADWDPANWLLVLLATSLPVGSIYFGSDLVAKVLHRRPQPFTPSSKTPDRGINQSTSDRDDTDTRPARPLVDPAPATVLAPVDRESDDNEGPRTTVAAESTRSRSAIGRVPQSARSPRPKRTPAELLEEARSATSGWKDSDLTAEGIRQTVRTSAAKARELRDTLRAERDAGRAAEQRHLMEAPELEEAFARLAVDRAALDKAA